MIQSNRLSLLPGLFALLAIFAFFIAATEAMDNPPAAPADGSSIHKVTADKGNKSNQDEDNGSDSEKAETNKTTPEESVPDDSDPYRGYPEAVILLDNGQVVHGGLKFQGDDQVILVIAGIDLVLDRKEVRRLELLPPVEERYREKRSQIDDHDYVSRLNLAEWLREEGALDLALKEAGAVLDAQPDNHEARKLFYTIGEQLALRSRKGKGSPRAVSRLSRAELLKLLPDDRLSEDDVNLLRVYEVNLKHPPRIVVPRDVRERLIEQYTGNPLIPTTREARALLMREPDDKVLALIFKLGAKEFYPEVRVMGQPESLRLFRDDVHRRWLLPSCGTIRCHGGPFAGRFFLYTKDRASDRTVYSNFLTIERFRTSDNQSLLDYENPEESILFQYGLPHDLAQADHPDVRGWHPVFRNMQDRTFRKSVRWVKSLYRPRPHHRIDYQPPRVSPDILPGGTENEDGGTHR
ncbi:MAG TPA: hypothetical protein ENJ06_05370 [Phycisphaeraceae bacterium]|nr:hypothetical protein [Phycisphaeraceae bacterium]